MDLFLILSIIVSLLTLFIGGVVYFRNRKSLINQLFFLFTFSVFIWIIGVVAINFVYQLPKEKALIIGRIPFLAATLICTSLFYFVQFFPKKTIFFPKIVNFFILLLSTFIASSSLFTNLILQDIIFKDTIPTAKQGIFIPLFGLFFIALVSLSIGILILKYKRSKGIERVQIFYLFLGLAISLFFGTLTNLVIPQMYPSLYSYRYGPVGVIFFTTFTALAITRYHLFEIKVILTELLVGVIGLILLIQIFSAPSFGWRATNSVIFILFLIFGYYLIKTTHEESKRREEAERLAIQERALRERTERLAQARDQFLLSAQHYFRTPLTSIIGFLSMIEEGIYGKEKISQVLKSAQELKKRIEESLTISQFQIGKGILEKKEIQLEDFLKEIIEEFRPQIEEKKLFIETDFPREKLPEIKIDPQRMREVFSNLIDNAIKHTQKGGITLGLKHLKEKNSILFWVKDTGIGIPKEELLLIGKEPFERGEEAKKLSPMGKGIGLYLSYLIIKAHQGKLWPESQGRGKGSTFYVELPIK